MRPSPSRQQGTTVPSHSTASCCRRPWQNSVPLSGASGSGQSNFSACSRKICSASRRFPRRSVGRSSTSPPSRRLRKSSTSPLRRSRPPMFHRRRAHRVPSPAARRQKSHTPERYASSPSARSFPSKLCRDTLTLWTPANARPRRGSSVPLVVIHTRKSSCRAMARISSSCGCSSGSPITWRYRCAVWPRSFSASSRKSSGRIYPAGRRVPGQKEQARLHTSVIST